MWYRKLVQIHVLRGKKDNHNSHHFYSSYISEELGRHSDRDGRVECTLCGAECESVVHVLWECSSYSTCRDNFQEALKQLLSARYAEFETLSAVEKTSYVLSSENWEDDFDVLLHLGCM